MCSLMLRRAPISWVLRPFLNQDRTIPSGATFLIIEVRPKFLARDLGKLRYFFQMLDRHMLPCRYASAAHPQQVGDFCLNAEVFAK